MPTENIERNNNYDKWYSLLFVSLFGLICGMGFLTALAILIPEEGAPDWFKAVSGVLAFFLIYIFSARLILKTPRTSQGEKFDNALKWVISCCIASIIASFIINRTMTYDILVVFSLGFSLIIVVSTLLVILIVSFWAIDSRKRHRRPLKTGLKGSRNN